jgi:hypothetical protein
MSATVTNDAFLVKGLGLDADMKRRGSLPRRTKRKAAEHEGTGVVGENLIAILAFLADEGNSFELSEPELCNPE